MTELIPYLKDKPVYLKFIALLLLVTVSMVITMTVGVLAAIPFFGTQVLESFTSPMDFSDPGSVGFLKYFQVVNQLGVFILPVIGYAYLESRSVVNYLKMNRSPRTSLLFISFLMIMVSIPAVNWMITVNEKMHLPQILKPVENWMRESEDSLAALTDAFLKTNSISGLLVNLFIIGFLAAVGEELLFRGVILRIFLDWSRNAHLAVVLSSVIFSAFHMQFFGFLPRMFLGILLGYAFVTAGSLWSPVILHFIFNAISVAGAFLYERGMITDDLEQLGQTGNPLIIALSFTLSLMFVMVLNRRTTESGNKF